MPCDDEMDKLHCNKESVFIKEMVAVAAMRSGTAPSVRHAASGT